MVLSINSNYGINFYNKYRKSYEPARAFHDLWARVMF